MKRFGTFARNRQNGFVALTLCFVAEAGDDTFAMLAPRLSVPTAVAFCPVARLPARVAAATEGRVGPAVPAAAVRPDRTAATGRPVAATAARLPELAARPSVADAAAG